MIDECPITKEQLLSALVQGSFELIPENQLDGWAGLEGTGYQWETETCLVVLDVLPERLHFQVYQDPPSRCWFVEMDFDKEFTDVY